MNVTFHVSLVFRLKAGLADDTMFSFSFDDGFCLVPLEAVASKIAARSTRTIADMSVESGAICLRAGF